MAEKLDILVVGATPAALRCEAKAKELKLKAARIDRADGNLPPAFFQVDATEDGSLGLRRCVFTRTDVELRSETGECRAPA